MSSKGLDPNLHRPAAGRDWVPLVRRGLFIAAAVGGALILAVAAFNFVIMPQLVRQGKEIEVPIVTQVTLETAVQILAEAGLGVRDTLERHHPTLPAGFVLDQQPGAGRHVKPERRIRLVVSRGGREHTVPALAGQTLRFARLALGQEGYVLGDVVRVPSANAPRDFVIATDPPEGTVLAPDRPVSMLVSAGPEPLVLVLPDLRGERLTRIEEELRFAGFEVTTTVEPGAAFSWRLQVVDTVPPPGSRIRPGDPVTLVGG
jgi:serine/threonine-protein kinase